MPPPDVQHVTLAADIVCLNWAFGIISGFGRAPHQGPYPPITRAPGDGGGKMFSTGEMMRELIWLMLSALGRAYITARCATTRTGPQSLHHCATRGLELSSRVRGTTQTG